MKREYDFSKGIRGKFYRPDVQLQLPVYLDEDVADLVIQYAEQRQQDIQTVVNEILRRNKEALQVPVADQSR
ncbi:MAG: hypothetical protein J7575_01750 [Chloroflexi bacterium]|jgi:hypothetical protein|nr:hypothetical protein [Chloroflexota bacterium]